MQAPQHAALAIALVAVMSAAAPVTAQQLRALGNPTEIPGEFSSIRGLLALPDGRLVITDAREKRIVLLDPTRKTASSLARSGQGPKEYQAVGTVQRDKGGGVVVYDPQQKRFLPIGPDGSVREVRAIPNVPRAMTIVMGDGPDLYTADTLGHIFTTEGGMPNSASPKRTIIRESRGDKVTVAELQLPESRRIEAGQGITMSQAVTFSPRDVWAVAPDGWVAVVRAAPFRVEWYPPTGAAVRGAVVPYQPIRVTEADKQAVREEQERNMAGGNRPTATINGQSFRPTLPAPVFAATKPPFTGRVALIDERGRLWVERSKEAGVAGVTLDVFDRTGAVVERFTLPEGHRVVGFDRSNLYATRTDEDDVVHLWRFALP